jgi:hypothetical protein
MAASEKNEVHMLQIPPLSTIRRFIHQNKTCPLMLQISLLAGLLHEMKL